MVNSLLASHENLQLKTLLLLKLLSFSTIWTVGATFKRKCLISFNVGHRVTVNVPICFQTIARAISISILLICSVPSKTQKALAQELFYLHRSLLSSPTSWIYSVGTGHSGKMPFHQSPKALMDLESLLATNPLPFNIFSSRRTPTETFPF